MPWPRPRRRAGTTDLPALRWIIGIGVTGAMFLLQSALQAGRLAASQPGLTITDPLVATVWGVALLDETIRSGPFLIPEIVGVAAIAAGVLVLARSPLLAAESGRHEQDEPAETAQAIGPGDGQ